MARRKRKTQKGSTATLEMSAKKATTKSVKVLTPEEKEAKAVERRKAYHASDYYLKVNKVNAETKEYTKTLKGARTILLQGKNEGGTSLTGNFLNILRKSKSSDAVWKHMENNVRPNAMSGKFNTHSLLQYLRKNETELLELIKSGK